MKWLVVRVLQEPLLWEYRTKLKVSSSAAQRLQLLSKSSDDRGRFFRYRNIYPIYPSYTVTSSVHLPLNRCRCFLEHQSMRLKSLKPHCIGPGVCSSIWNFWGLLASSTGVSGRFVCSFQTDSRCPIGSITYPMLPQRQWMQSLQSLHRTTLHILRCAFSSTALSSILQSTLPSRLSNRLSRSLSYRLLSKISGNSRLETQLIMTVYSVQPQH